MSFFGDEIEEINDLFINANNLIERKGYGKVEFSLFKRGEKDNKTTIGINFNSIRDSKLNQRIALYTIDGKCDKNLFDNIYNFCSEKFAEINKKN